MTYCISQNDVVWKALSDGRRRSIVEALATGPKRTGDLVDLFPDIGRTGVLKHIKVLTEGGIIDVHREGRTRWNHLNSEPIEAACSSWVAKHISGLKASADTLKQIAEKGTEA